MIIEHYSFYAASSFRKARITEEKGKIIEQKKLTVANTLNLWKSYQGTNEVCCLEICGH